jgi:hypothetical protein
MSDETEVDVCPGPLIWRDVAVDSALGAVLECTACDYFIATGSFHDQRHSGTPLVREGLAT